MRGASIGAIIAELLPAVLLCTLFAAVGVLHVAARVKVVDLGYRLSRLEQEARTLAREQDALELELATLKSPARLERLAREKLGMRPPGPGEVISISAGPARLAARGRAP